MENKNRLKILLVANTGWYLYNFRLPLARFLRLQGIEVVLVSPWDAYVERLQAEGFRWIQLRLSRRSVNPLVELLTIA
ncbi:MAG: glycosyltransferase, partial [Cyanobacteriota bacterium]